MAVNWNLYLARYQKSRGGVFFGSGAEECDSQLILTEGERAPLLVSFSTDPCGRYTTLSLKARTMVQLERDYHLHIRECSLVGKGVGGVLNLVGVKSDYGYPEITKQRIITTDNKPFTKQVLGDLEFRNALLARTKDCIKVSPGPQGDGWHQIEVWPSTLEGVLDGSDWLIEPMTRDLMFYEKKDREAVLAKCSAHFDAQMDGLLNLLRCAQRAVTTWRMG